MPPAPFRRITIIGVGLIGGSLGMAVRKQIPDAVVTGCDRPEVLREAVRRKAIHRGERRLSHAVANADLVILATPISRIGPLLRRLSGIVPATTVVTDVASVKSTLVREGGRLFPSGNFAGGHPMAGIELTGVRAAHPLLFQNAIYVLTPARSTSRKTMRRLAVFFRTIGSRAFVLDAETHDSVASTLSHVPQLAAVALMNLAGRRNGASRRYLRLGAGGFRDMTRIASSPFTLWSDILSANTKEIVRSLAALERILATYRRAVQSRAMPDVRRAFRSSRRLRTGIPRDMKGFVHRLSPLEVFVEDRPGMLARLTAALAVKRINIKDIELMKVREGTGGTFRLSFETTEDKMRARRVLRLKGFQTGG